MTSMKFAEGVADDVVGVDVDEDDDVALKMQLWRKSLYLRLRMTGVLMRSSWALAWLSRLSNGATL